MRPVGLFNEAKVADATTAIPTHLYVGDHPEHLPSELKIPQENIISSVRLKQLLDSAGSKDPINFFAQNIYLDIVFQHFNQHDNVDLRKLHIECQCLHLLSSSVFDFSGQSGLGHDEKLIGANGYPGGKVELAIYSNELRHNDCTLTVKVNGGAGAKGGKGNIGARGAPGKSGTNDTMKKSGRSIIGVNKGRRATPGGNGKPGGRGGNGGNGGDGGYIGYYHPGGDASWLIAEAKPGEPGQPGAPGDKGPKGIGGKEGVRLIFVPEKIIPPHAHEPDPMTIPATCVVDKNAPKKAKDGHEGPPGKPGSPGQPGKPGTIDPNYNPNVTEAAAEAKI